MTSALDGLPAAPREARGPRRELVLIVATILGALTLLVLSVTILGADPLMSTCGGG